MTAVKKSQEIVEKKTTTTELTIPEPMVDTQEILNSDIVIPKLLLMQGLSDLVNERKAQQGDMVRSTTAEVIGGPGKPVDFIPLKMTSEWVLQEKIGGKFEYRGTEPRTALNENDPWEFRKDGADWRRVKTLNVYALLPQDIANFQKEMEEMTKSGEMPDLNKTILPVQISFRSTSFNAGKSVATFYAQVRDMKRYNPVIQPYHYTLSLSCFQDKNDKGSYYVFEVGKTKKLDSKLVDEASRWYAILNALKEIKVDTSDENESGVVGTSSSHF